jgi:hypothetical protein
MKKPAFTLAFGCYWMILDDKWWRRRESNPRPKLLSTESFHAFPAFIFVSSSTLRTGEDAATTSLIDLVRPAQTEQGRPAYCATIGTSP